MKKREITAIICALVFFGLIGSLLVVVWIPSVTTLKITLTFLVLFGVSIIIDKANR